MGPGPTVLVPRPLDLIGRSRRAPRKVAWKLAVVRPPV